MRLAGSALRTGYRLNTYHHLVSTNDEALYRASAGDRGRLWIVAGTQSGGRGRYGRPWVSPLGNLFATLLLTEGVEPSVAPQLSFVSAVALARSLAEVLGTRRGLAIKWPNDILAGDAKVAGILVEGTWGPSRAFAALVGIGVNCEGHPTGLSYPVTDLSTFHGRTISREAVFEVLSGVMDETLRRWDGGQGFAAIRSDWMELAVPVGTPMTVTHNRARVSGTFKTMDARGRLVLGTAGGLRTIDVGDVALAERSADRG